MWIFLDGEQSNFETSKMKIETQIHLNKFKPRWYQAELMDAIENKGYRRALAVWPRRAGKDMVGWWMAIRQCIRFPCTVFYLFPTYSQAKKVIWSARTSDGGSFFDMIPPELLKAKNSSELKVIFTNGSILQLVGSDNFDSLMGTNPMAAIFSEWALQDERAYQYLRPALTHNDGWALFITTPRGKNHAFSMYQMALESPEWHCSKLTVEETSHIPLIVINKEKADGIMSDDLIQQEYYTSFDMGVEGAYYAKYFDKLRLNNQIGQVPHEVGFKVNTCWDLGMRDSTCIIFYQVIGQTIRVIDCYENSKEGLEHYVHVLESRSYSYNRHFFPHDVKVRELGTGISRLAKLRELGIKGTVAPDVSIPDGIEAVRSSLGKMWFDAEKCAPLIKALENYRQEYDVKKKTYKQNPLHNWASHFADSMRYLCITLPKIRDGLTSEEIDKNYREAMFGDHYNIPDVFKDPRRY